MSRCLNCIHFDVCDTDRHEKERLYNDCSDFLNEADVVEVVRCKDCIYFVSGICRQDLALNLARGDDFCSYGERREK